MLAGGGSCAPLPVLGGALQPELRANQGHGQALKAQKYIVPRKSTLLPASPTSVPAPHPLFDVSPVPHPTLEADDGEGGSW